MPYVDDLPTVGEKYTGKDGVVKRVNRTAEGTEVTIVLADEGSTRPVDPGPLLDPQVFVYEGVPADQQEAAFLGVERSADSIGAAPDGSHTDADSRTDEDVEAAREAEEKNKAAAEKAALKDKEDKVVPKAVNAPGGALDAGKSDDKK